MLFFIDLFSCAMCDNFNSGGEKRAMNRLKANMLNGMYRILAETGDSS